MNLRIRPTLLLSALSALSAIAIAAAPANAATRMAHITIKGEVTETAPEFTLSLTFNPVKPNTLRELTDRIKKAAGDGKIDELLITLSNPSMGLAQAEELRAALVNFKKSGKKIRVYAESADMTDYMVATAADELVLMPAGDLDLHGMAMELHHFKGLLDKLGVEADFIRNGKYKSAIEPMTERKPSEATMEMMNKLLDDMYDTVVGHIATGRKLTADQVKKLIDQGPYTSEEALAAKLIDKVAAFETYKQELKQNAVGQFSLVENYGVVKQTADFDFDSPLAMFKLFGELMAGKKEKPKDNTPKIALIYAEGAISSGESSDGAFGGKGIGSDTFNKAIRTAREDPSVKAVVIRIDSPGGSALASEAMWREIKMTAEKKRVIASMGNYAASGGYYIASAAEVIVAEPGTLTGSIGVFGGKMVLKGTFEKLDIDVTRVARGANAGIYSSSTKFSDSERAVVERHIKKIYDIFLDRVASGRNMDKEAVHKIAQGRVWSGAAAKQIGLVDELGGLSHAIAIASEKVGLRDPKIEVFPKQKNFLDMLMEGLGLGGGNDARIGVMAAAARHPELRTLFTAFSEASRPAARMLSMVQLMEKEKVMMAMPFVFEIK